MRGEILLIRHSLTEANEKGLYCGKTDLPLSTKGKTLAADLAKERNYKAEAYCSFFTSGMKRTDETLELLFGNVEFEAVSELREMNFGDFEMFSYEELKQRQDYQKWITGDNIRNKCPSGESAEDMAERVIAAFSNIIKYPSAVVITHGGVIAAIMAHYFQKEEKNRYQWQPEPCRGYCLYTENAYTVSYYKI